MIITFGHSTLTQEQANRILTRANIELLVDIRSHPTSHWEWWRQENMDWLELDYAWMPQLGGWRDVHIDPWNVNRFLERGVDIRVYGGQFPKQRIGAKREGPGWTSQGLYDYQFFQTLNEYRAGLQQLVHLGRERRVAIMCAEALWWKCHRSMVADSLIAAHSEEVWHLMAMTDRREIRTEKHTAAERLGRYDPWVLDHWALWRGERANGRGLDTEAQPVLKSGYEVAGRRERTQPVK